MIDKLVSSSLLLQPVSSASGAGELLFSFASDVAEVVAGGYLVELPPIFLNFFFVVSFFRVEESSSHHRCFSVR